MTDQEDTTPCPNPRCGLGLPWNLHSDDEKLRCRNVTPQGRSTEELIPGTGVTFVDLTNGTVQGLEDDEKKLHDLIEQCAVAQDHADQCRTGWINDDKATPEMMMAASQAHRGAEAAIDAHIKNMVGKRARTIADERKNPPEKLECSWKGGTLSCESCDLMPAIDCIQFRSIRRSTRQTED